MVFPLSESYTSVLDLSFGTGALCHFSSKERNFKPGAFLYLMFLVYKRFFLVALVSALRKFFCSSLSGVAFFAPEGLLVLYSSLFNYLSVINELSAKYE